MAASTCSLGKRPKREAVMWPLCGPGCEARKFGEELVSGKGSTCAQNRFWRNEKPWNIKSRGLVGNGPSGGFKAESFLSGALCVPSGASCFSIRCLFCATVCTVPRAGYQGSALDPPCRGLSPAGGFPLPGALPCRGLPPPRATFGGGSPCVRVR